MIRGTSVGSYGKAFLTSLVVSLADKKNKIGRAEPGRGGPTRPNRPGWETRTRKKKKKQNRTTKFALVSIQQQNAQPDQSDVQKYFL